jgi:tRNA threonylcarbamoyladenosine biosynthesis protein TsaE
VTRVSAAGALPESPPPAVELNVTGPSRMRDLGRRLATMLRAGDLVLLTGDLGAGKTTLTQGIGAGLEVRGPITSPTFVIARVHPPLRAGAPLVHVDAYRLAGWDELEDLDLETTMDEAVTVVEWGFGLAEGLADDRLEIAIVRSPGSRATADVADADPRTLTVRPVGPRWAGVPLHELMVPGP